MTLLETADALQLELLLLFLFGTYAAAAIGGALDFNGSRGRRYASYRRPAFAPPAWLFGGAWSLLYTAQGVAAFLVRTSRAVPYAPADVDGTRRALVLYALLQALLALYIPFSGNLGISLVNVLASAVLAIVVTVQFFAFSVAAGWLMVALVAWLLFASLLSISLLVLNSGDRLRSAARSQSTSDGLRRARQKRLSASSADRDAGYEGSLTNVSSAAHGRKKKRDGNSKGN